MKTENASPVIFGFDFQVNAAIVLMLENIKELKRLRLEGASEDIELTMENGKKIFAQAKSVVKASSDFNNVRTKLKKAIETLSKSDGKDVEKLILITNSVNPLNEETSKGFFYGPPTDVQYCDLPEDGKKIIDGITDNLGVSFNKVKFRIKFFRFETDNETERYKVVLQMIQDFICRIGVNKNVSASELMGIWQNDIFRNGSKNDTTIQIDKDGIVWPIIVLAIGHNAPHEFLDDYDQGLADEISAKYSELIDNSIERYEMVTRVLYDFNKCSVAYGEITQKKRVQQFVESCWKDYIEILELHSLDKELQEGISRIVLSKVIQQRYTIDAIKKGVTL